MFYFHCTPVTVVAGVCVLPPLWLFVCANVSNLDIWKTLIHWLLSLTLQTGSYDLNPEGMGTFKGKTPSRYSYLVQGHENPYFLPQDNKKNWKTSGQLWTQEWGTWDQKEVTDLTIQDYRHISSAGYLNMFELDHKSQMKTATKEFHSYEQKNIWTSCCEHHEKANWFWL